MADTNKISEVLEHLLNNEQQKAEDLFHEYVVAKSREIYENLIDAEIEEATDEDEDEDEKEVDESTESDDEADLDENFDEVEEAGDETDDFMGDIEADNGEDEEGEDEEGEEGGDEPATKDDVQDLAAAIDELQAAFDAYAAGEDNEEENMPGIHDEEGMKDDITMGLEMPMEGDLETVREYVEKVPGGHGAEKKGAGEAAGANAKSAVAGKNDMGGTTANILSSKEEAGTMAGQGQLKGNGLLKGTPKEDDAGNVNKVGGTSAKAFYSKNSQGHGAEKAGSKESGTDATSLIRGSR